jgi:hypothetical protein
MTRTDLANIALSHLGARRLTDLDTDTSVEARSALLHFDLTFRSLLRRHQWNFGTKRLKLEDTTIPAVPASLTIAGLTITSTVPGAAGNNIQATTAIDSVTNRDIIILTFNAGILTITSGDQVNTGPDTAATLAQVLVTADQFPGFTFAIAQGSDPTDLLTAEPLDAFTVGIDTLTPNRSLSAEFPFTFPLPADCVRLIRLASTDQHNPVRSFSIEGRHILTHAPSFELVYVTTDCLDDLDDLFIEAFTLSLASKLAGDVVADPALKSNFLAQIEQLHLPAAQGADAKEVKSGENFGPRALASMSGLVNARFRNDGRPPYTPTIAE